MEFGPSTFPIVSKASEDLACGYIPGFLVYK